MTGLWNVLGMCGLMVLAAYVLPRHFAWLDRRKAERDGEPERRAGR